MLPPVSVSVPAFCPPLTIVKVTFEPAELIANVGGPTPPMINEPTESDTGTVTVYVPARSIIAVSAAVGTVPLLQLAPSFQLPPPVLIHRTCPDRTTVNAALVSAVRPVAVARSV